MRIDYCKSPQSLWQMGQQFISFKSLVIVFSSMSRAWEAGNNMGTQLLGLQGTDRVPVVIVSYLSGNIFSSLISVVIFFYNWTSILLESDVTLGILAFSFLFSKIGYPWSNSLDSMSPYNLLILENLKCDNLRDYFWMWKLEKEDTLLSDSDITDF